MSLFDKTRGNIELAKARARAWSRERDAKLQKKEQEKALKNKLAYADAKEVVKADKERIKAEKTILKAKEIKQNKKASNSISGKIKNFNSKVEKFGNNFAKNDKGKGGFNF